MYRCSTCIYRRVCQGAHGTRTCDGYRRETKKERYQIEEFSRQPAFFQGNVSFPASQIDKSHNEPEV